MVPGRVSFGDWPLRLCAPLWVPLPYCPPVPLDPRSARSNSRSSSRATDFGIPPNWRSCRACAMASASRSPPNDDGGSPPNCCRHRWRSSDRESRSKSPRSQSDRRRAGIGHSCCPMHAHIHPKSQSATAARRPTSSFRLLALKAREVCSVNISRLYSDVADWSVHDPQRTFGPLPGFGKTLGACQFHARPVPSAIVRGHRANVSRGLTAAHDPVELSRERGLFTAIAADDSDSAGDTARSRYERSKSEQTLRVTMSDPRTVGGGNRNLFQKRACLGHRATNREMSAEN